MRKAAKRKSSFFSGLSTKREGAGGGVKRLSTKDFFF